MKYGPLVFLAAFFALSLSWFGFVLTPQIQLGRALPETNVVNTAELYPQGRPGLARQGLEIYRANGCAACHSQYVRQTGSVCNVILTDVGTNPVAVVHALLNANLGFTNISAPILSAGLPKPILRDVSIDTAIVTASAMKPTGGKIDIEIVPLGPDMIRGRGWGKRLSVAADYLYDSPVLLGSQRVGPDLANVGVRMPDANWHLLHLYAPASQVKGSLMPPYRFLFEKRKRKIEWHASPDALQFPKDFPDAPESDYEIVPKPEARALVAYLLSLGANVSLFEAPMYVPPPPPAATNAPTATNTPPK
jgi:cbb3-type cytochrome oxidase cytochrome c subunit